MGVRCWPRGAWWRKSSSTGTPSSTSKLRLSPLQCMHYQSCFFYKRTCGCNACGSSWCWSFFWITIPLARACLPCLGPDLPASCQLQDNTCCFGFALQHCCLHCNSTLVQLYVYPFQQTLQKLLYLNAGAGLLSCRPLCMFICHMSCFSIGSAHPQHRLSRSNSLSHSTRLGPCCHHHYSF